MALTPEEERAFEDAPPLATSTPLPSIPDEVYAQMKAEMAAAQFDDAALEAFIQRFHKVENAATATDLPPLERGSTAETILKLAELRADGEDIGLREAINEVTKEIHDHMPKTPQEKAALLESMKEEVLLMEATPPEGVDNTGVEDLSAARARSQGRGR